jgi:phosphatidylglycerol---prolipoprotein diacylglyceryl transferase
MNFLINFINWDVSPEIFNLGPVSVRWYGLLFALSFVFGYMILTRIFVKEDKPKTDVEQLSVYVIFGTVIGARLGHCLFYNPVYYLSNPIEILKVWEGGLASHGAALGILIALYLYSRKKKDQNYFWLLDRLVIVVALGGSLIRLGNLFNSEIYGIETQVPWAFIFPNGAGSGMVPRHPTQIYESLAYLISFVILFVTYNKRRKIFNNGFLFGLFLILVFTFRFFVEFIKAVQEPFEANLPLKMGQWLSIPFVLIGIYFLIKGMPKKSAKSTDTAEKKKT